MLSNQSVNPLNISKEVNAELNRYHVCSECNEPLLTCSCSDRERILLGISKSSIARNDNSSTTKTKVYV